MQIRTEELTDEAQLVVTEIENFSIEIIFDWRHSTEASHNQEAYARNKKSPFQKV